jgi:hypothetical protein
MIPLSLPFCLPTVRHMDQISPAAVFCGSGCGLVCLSHATQKCQVTEVTEPGDTRFHLIFRQQFETSNRRLRVVELGSARVLGTGRNDGKSPPLT